jgi:hypothetical protein
VTFGEALVTRYGVHLETAVIEADLCAAYEILNFKENNLREEITEYCIRFFKQRKNKLQHKILVSDK